MTCLDSLISDTLVRFVPKADGSFDICPPLLSTLCTSTLVLHPASRQSPVCASPSTILDSHLRCRAIRIRSCFSYTAALMKKTFLIWYAVCSRSSKDQPVFHHFEVPRAQCVSKLGSFTRKDECHSLTSILGLHVPRNKSISTQIRTPHAPCLLSCQQGCPTRYELNKRGC